MFDVYLNQSIKTIARQNKANPSNAIVYKTIMPSQVVQQWGNFKKSAVNKTALVRFIVAQWQKGNSTCRSKLVDLDIVLSVTLDDKCYRITGNTVESVDELKYSHEEADSKNLMMLHTAHVSKFDYESVIVASTDTDVVLLCLANCHKISTPIFQRYGTENRVQYIENQFHVKCLGCWCV